MSDDPPQDADLFPDDATLSSNTLTAPDDATIRKREVDDRPPSEEVVRALADALDRDPLDLPPLHDVLDPDALDDLFADTPSGIGREGRFVFECCGCTVAVLGSEEVAVTVDD